MYTIIPIKLCYTGWDVAMYSNYSIAKKMIFISIMGNPNIYAASALNFF
jgi:hypothetical protein